MGPYRDDVEEVVISEGVQYGGDRLSGDGESQSLHASANVHQDHHILGGCRCLDVPVHGRTKQKLCILNCWTGGGKN